MAVQKAVAGWIFRPDRGTGAFFIGKYAFLKQDLRRKLCKFSKKIIVAREFDDYYR